MQEFGYFSIAPALGEEVGDLAQMGRESAEIAREVDFVFDGRLRTAGLFENRAGDEGQLGPFQTQVPRGMDIAIARLPSVC